MSSVDRTGFAAVPGDDALTTPILSDSLDAAGWRDQVLEQHLAPLVPGSRAFGRATTIRFAPFAVDDEAGRSDPDPYRAAIDFIDGISPGQLVVVATGQSNASAYWGELFSAAAMGSGAVGVITDGNLRDTPKIAGLGFPAFASSRRPIDYRARMKVAETSAPVRVGGVTIHPGDLVLADDDGIVVIPHAAEEAVLALARTRAHSESTVLKELLAGESLSTVWDRHHIL